MSCLRSLRMRKAAIMYDVGLVFAGAAVMAHAQISAPQTARGQTGPVQQGGSRGGVGSGGQQPMPPGPNPNSQYRLGPDSMPHEGVPKGEIRGPYTLPSKAYPGTQHTYWVYVPSQYDKAVCGCLNGLSRWAGLQRRKRGYSGTVRDG